MNGVLMASDLYPGGAFMPGAQKTVSEIANGSAESGKAQSAPAFAWVGIVLALIGVRLLWEFASKE